MKKDKYIRECKGKHTFYRTLHIKNLVINYICNVIFVHGGDNEAQLRKIFLISRENTTSQKIEMNVLYSVSDA